MIWFDLVTPKSVMFFEPLIRATEAQGQATTITTRGGLGYSETHDLLEMKGLRSRSMGRYGGKSVVDKLDAALDRQRALSEFVRTLPIDRLVSLCSVDGCRVAFGHGLPIVTFCDLPTGASDQYTHVARLTLPISNKIFYPNYIKKSIFVDVAPAVELIAYDFLDPAIYLQNQIPERGLIESLPIDRGKPVFCYREEEFCASYVSVDRGFVFEELGKLGSNLVAIPRYDLETLRSKLPNAIVLDRKIELCQVLPYVDAFVGGGGTVTVEACYWNVPAVSVRSFVSHYDRYLIERGMLTQAQDGPALSRFINSIRIRPKTIERCFDSVDVDSLVFQVLN